MFLLYTALAAAWGWLCYKHVTEILPIQVTSIPVTTLLDLLRIVLSLLSHWLPYSRDGRQLGYVFLCLIRGRFQIIFYQAYYRYLNAHGKGPASTVFLFVVAILDAGRNSLSFFMLLVVSLGLSVVRDDLGRTMRKAQLLSAAHFIFGGSISPLRAPEPQLRHFYSPVRRRHRRTPVRVNVSTGAPPFRGATSIHIECIPHVDPMVPQR
jgi:hypothetical protein